MLIHLCQRNYLLKELLIHSKYYNVTCLLIDSLLYSNWIVHLDLYFLTSFLTLSWFLKNEILLIHLEIKCQPKGVFIDH